MLHIEEITPIHRTYKGERTRLTVRLNKTLHEKLLISAAFRGRDVSINDLIEEAITQYLDNPQRG